MKFYVKSVIDLGIRKNLPCFGPMATDSVFIGQLCPGCQKVFGAGDYVTLIALGPGNDRVEQKKAAAGVEYKAIAVEGHWQCITGEDPNG